MTDDHCDSVFGCVGWKLYNYVHTPEKNICLLQGSKYSRVGVLIEIRMMFSGVQLHILIKTLTASQWLLFKKGQNTHAKI